MMRIDDIIRRAVSDYGRKSQILKSIEELSELTRAVCRCENDHNLVNWQNLV